MNNSLTTPQPTDNQKTNKDVEKILAEYKEKSSEIIRKMLQVLAQAHKKVDQIEYKKWASNITNK